MTDREIIGGVDVSRETADRLRRFAALVAKWTPRINLIASSSVAEIWDRHIVDSVQILPLAPENPRHWVDIGSGGGFPGVVIAALLAERAPDARVTMIESDQRKATFLRTALRELGLQGAVIAARIEQAPPQGGDVVSARALSALSDLIGLALPHLAEGGVAIFPKGRRAHEEITEARVRWDFNLTQTPSITDPTASILRLERIRRV